MKLSSRGQLWLIAALLAAVAGLMGYQLVDALRRGVVLAFSRVGHSTAYALADQPKQYCLTVVGLATIATTLIVLTAVTAHVARKLPS